MNEAFVWLNMLDKNPKEIIPLFQQDFNLLSKLVPAETVRVIKNNDGENRIFFINKQNTIKMLKEFYGFHTKEEASKELIDDIDIPT